MEIKRSAKSCTFTFATDYATYVHNGVTFTNGTKLPARPWTKTAIADFDFEGTFGKLFQKYGDFDRAFKETCYLLSNKFTQEISDVKWQWADNELRDIVDTGVLRASQQVEFDG